MINAVWTMSNGKAKFKGLSPCHTPLDEVFTAVMLKGILAISGLVFVFFISPVLKAIYLEHVMVVHITRSFVKKFIGKNYIYIFFGLKIQESNNVVVAYNLGASFCISRVT